MGSTPNNGQFYDGAPVIEPVVLYGANGKPISSTNPLDVNVDVTVSPTSNQRVNAQSGDFVAGSIVDLATIAAAIISSKMQSNTAQIGGQPPTLDNTSVLATSMRGKNATAGDTPLVVVTGDGLTQTNVLAAGLELSNGGAALDRWRAINGVGDGATFGFGAVGTWLFNGSSWDQQRSNMDNITLLASSARTTTQTVSDQTNFTGRGVIVVLDMTNVGTGSVTLEIDGKDPVSGKYYAILTGAAVTTNSTNIYRVYPGLTAAANATANDVLPRTWRVKVTANNANSATYSVGAIISL